MGLAGKSASFMRRAKRSLHHFLVLVLAVSALSAISIAKAPEAAATLTNENCAPTVTGFTVGTTVTAVANGSDCVITFTSGSGTWTRPTGLSNVKVLIVGGGGAGGGGIGGGGGAGQLIESSSFDTTGQTSISISIGAGGTGGTGSGGSGGSSVFGALTAGGGGGGGKNNTSNPTSGVSGTGGSGSGGGGGFSISGATGAKAGGTGSSGSCASATSGGGGGAGTNGSNGEPATQTGGNGGEGVASSITGSSLIYAGGGGGGVNGLRPCVSTGSAGLGGNKSVENERGGAGNGGLKQRTSDTDQGTDPSLSGLDATSNTGGGGGGASNSRDEENERGGNGGSGVVIVRYAFPPAAPTITSVTSGPTNLSVAFTAPTSNGATITGYEYSINGGTNWTTTGGTTSPFTIPNLTNGTEYTVLLRAIT